MENEKENIEEGAQKSPKKWKNRKRLLPSILISVSMPLIICLAVPFEIYSNNMQEFFFGIWDFLPLCIVFGLLFTGAILCALLFLPDCLYKIAAYFVLMFALLMFIQGNYMNGNMNSLAGDNLGTGTTSMTMKIINLVVWIVLLGGAVGVAFIKDKRDITGKVALVLACIVIIAHLVIPIFAICTNDGVFTSKKDKLNSGNSTSITKFVSTKNITTISSKNNVFYFCIDRFDEYFAEEMYRCYPELFDGFDGFTHFRDNLSLYGHTFPSVAHMLTNYEYDISLSRVQNLNKAYDENTTLKTLHENGYLINLYGQTYYDYVNAGSLPEYVENISAVYECKVDDPALLSFNMMGLAFYRCCPLLMKPIFSKVNSDRCNSYVSLKDEYGYANFDSHNDKALKLVKDSAFETVGENVFTFMHFEGCHNENFDYKNGTATASSKVISNIKQSVTECFEIINLYISALKEEGVYEDATIIITGDHGISGNDNFGELSSSRLTALLVKPSGSAEDALKFSDAQVTHDNIWPMIMASENIRTEENFGTSLFDVNPDEDMVRKYVWQTYNRYSLDETHYEIKGLGRNFDNWEIVKTVHAGKYLMD